jgi:hypothetical protein
VHAAHSTRSNKYLSRDKQSCCWTSPLWHFELSINISIFLPQLAS